MEFVNSIAQIVHSEVRLGSRACAGRQPAVLRAGPAGPCSAAATAAGAAGGTCRVLACVLLQAAVHTRTSPDCLLLCDRPCVQVALHGGAANKNIGDAFLLVSGCRFSSCTVAEGPRQGAPGGAPFVAVLLRASWRGCVAWRGLLPSLPHAMPASCAQAVPHGTCTVHAGHPDNFLKPCPTMSTHPSAHRCGSFRAGARTACAAHPPSRPPARPRCWRAPAPRAAA